MLQRKISGKLAESAAVSMVSLHTCPPPKETLQEWLEEYPLYNGNFGHLLLLQKEIDREIICQGLRPYFESAHLDARQVFHDFIGIKLHPDADIIYEESVEYPRSLHSTTRKGLFGEVLAGLVAEGYELVGKHKWCVPVFLFRHHEDARNYLYDLARNPKNKRQTIGRLGSDFIGLLLDNNGAVIRFITGEAKWRKDLKPSVIKVVMYGEKVKKTDGENKIHSGKGVWSNLNNSPSVPSGVRQLATLLREHDPVGYDAAIFSMDQALLLPNPKPLPRTDLVIIAGNGAAKREKLERLLPFDRIPDDYTAGHDLQLVEVVLKDGEELIDALYESLWSKGVGDA